MKNIIIGDWLRFDITSIPNGVLTKCHIVLIGEI
jgi:hypothetical protein